MGWVIGETQRSVRIAHGNVKSCVAMRLEKVFAYNNCNRFTSSPAMQWMRSCVAAGIAVFIFACGSDNTIHKPGR